MLQNTWVDGRMKRVVHYEDKAGNKIITDTDGRLAVINREGKIVNIKGTSKLLKEAGISYKKSGKAYKIGGGETITPSIVSFKKKNSIWDVSDYFGGKY